MKRVRLGFLSLIFSMIFSGIVFADDHGNSCSSATTVSINSTTNGSIETGGDYDYFRVQVAGAGTLTVYTTGSTDTYGYLKDSGCSDLESDDDDGEGYNFLFSWSISAGTYYVAVGNYYSWGTGSYTLVVEFSGTGDGGGGGDGSTVSIPARTPWTSTGITVTAGQSLTITASGTWSMDSNRYVGPDGDSSPASSAYPLPGGNLHSLIGRIGSTVFYVGSSFSGTAPASGTLELGMNDSYFADNAGSLTATISTSGGSSSAYIVTVDGLSFGNTFLNRNLEDSNNYLETALESMNLGVPNEDIIPFSWADPPWYRDAGYTRYVISDPDRGLWQMLRSTFERAQREGKKFIVVSHSWGTVLTYLALSYDSNVTRPINCDLYITLGSPLGTPLARINNLGLTLDNLGLTLVNLIRSPNTVFEAFRSIFSDAIEISIWNYVANWFRILHFDSCSNCFPRVNKSVNYWAWGDLFSGPLSRDYIPTMNEREDNIRVDPDNTSRDVTSTIRWHAHDSLRARMGGVSIDNQPLRDRVRSLITETCRRVPGNESKFTISYQHYCATVTSTLSIYNLSKSIVPFSVSTAKRKV